jgi:lipid-binding SYLF domain-containing protein
VNQLTPSRIRFARGLAIVADAVQLGLFPLFGEGVLSVLKTRSTWRWPGSWVAPTAK